MADSEELLDYLRDRPFDLLNLVRIYFSMHFPPSVTNN